MKGLESLIPQKSNSGPEGSREKESVFLIDIEKIKPNPYQPRREFNPEELKNLADSIKVYGILQPLIVSKIDKEVPSGRQVEYELVAGERRLRAAKVANLPSVPVIIRHAINNTHKLEVALIENIQRNDLSSLEEAGAYKRLQEEFNMSQVDIAKRISKSRPYVANTIRILSLPQNIQDALSRGEINDGHTRPLLSLSSPDSQDKLFKEITNQRFTVRQAEERARELLAEPGGQKREGIHSGGKTEIDPKLADMVERFKNNFNISQAKVRADGRKVHLAISFSSKKDLSAWFETLFS